MKPYNDGVVTVAIQVHGLREAIARLEAASADRENADGTYVPLFEALNWAASLDDRVGAIWRPGGGNKKLGNRWHARLGGAEVVVAIDWVRNVVHHQWADALRLDPVGHGLYPSPSLFPSQSLNPRDEFAWVWREISELPRRRPRGRKGDTERASGEDMYRQVLQGRVAAETMRDLLHVFERAAELLEPPRRARNAG